MKTPPLFKAFQFALAALLYAWDAANACPTDSSVTGTIKATVVGIEVGPTCTFVLIKDVNTTLPELDTGGFVAGRFAYIALDPAASSYKPMLAIASVASATGTRIYARVVSRLAKASSLSFSKEENNNN